jgi:hypothetical protein
MLGFVKSSTFVGKRELLKGRKIFEPPLHPTESEKPQPIKITANSM